MRNESFSGTTSAAGVVRVRPTLALRIAGAKAIEVPPVGIQPMHFDMHGSANAAWLTLTLCHDVFHRVVGSNFPIHFDNLVGHAAAFDRLGREPGPEHEPIGRRVARADAHLNGSLVNVGLPSIAPSVIEPNHGNTANEAPKNELPAIGQ